MKALKFFIVFLFMLLPLLFLSGCNYTYVPEGVEKVSVEVSSVNFNEISQISSQAPFDFQPFKNGSIVKFNRDFKLFKITNKFETKSHQALMVLPHYFDEVYFFDTKFELLDTVIRNQYKEHRSYSTNIIAFDIEKVSSYSYVLIFNKSSRKALFSFENRVQLMSYDQQLSLTIVAVYAAIFTLFLVNVIFYYFVREKSYLYYALYLFFSFLFFICIVVSRRVHCLFSILGIPRFRGLYASFLVRLANCIFLVVCF